MAMEPMPTKRSPSPSGSEDVESDADSDHDDELENNGESQGEDHVENGKESEESDSDEEEEEEEEDEEGEEEEEEEEEDGSEQEVEEISQSQDGLGYESDKLFVKQESRQKKMSKDSDNENYGGDSDCYPHGDLPLEVITTVEPTNYAYPVLKNMSNGVLTHRNIFTEHERAVLKEIINKYRNIVDTRSRTREIYLEKQNVWQQIVEEYNGTENIMVRTEKELRKCWDNMKYRAKQAEKEMVKLELKVEQGFDGLENDLHTLAQQAIEGAAMQAKLMQRSGVLKTEVPEHPVKIEPVERKEEDCESDEDDEDDNHELSSGSNCGDDDKEPALKRARQESPKLSSLLMAAAHKRSSYKKNSGGHKNSGSNFNYSLPSCTKVMPLKKKNYSSTATHVNSNSSMAEIPILPKSLASCLSITNIPKPISVSIHGGMNFGSHGRDVLSPNSPTTQGSIKPMPSLKKMVPGKMTNSGSSRNSSSSGSKKSSNHSNKFTSHSNNSNSQNLGHSTANSNHINSVPISNTVTTNAVNEDDKSEVGDRLLNAKLATQRLEMERREHELRMKLMEKELQAQTYQSQYWYLKLKLLRSGRENAAFNLAGATNGDID